MRLIVSGLDAAAPPMRFKHLWGRYVYGFKPWKHCIGCFKSNKAANIFPAIKDGVIDVEDRLFYLCGVGDERSKTISPELIQRITNVHLAVYPEKGSIARADSPYGVSFAIEDARAIPIEVLPEPFQGLEEKHSRCKNFQFGYQMFEVNEVSLSPGEATYRLRERWRSIPGIAHDGDGYMGPAQR